MLVKRTADIFTSFICLFSFNPDKASSTDAPRKCFANLSGWLDSPSTTLLQVTMGWHLAKALNTKPR
jgi:hypothetical protein